MKHVLRMTLIVAGILSSVIVPSLAGASQYREAVLATAAEDYSRAMELWQKLAHQGDPVAMYNLALFYREGYGTNPNSNKSQNYLKTAVNRGGLVEASTSIKSGSIQPASKHQVDKVINTYMVTSQVVRPAPVTTSAPAVTSTDPSDPVGWVMSQNPGHYTLQLASSQSEKRIKRTFEENSLQGKGGYYKRERDGTTWYFLIYGAYENPDKATEDIAKLPEEFQKSSPWVRQLRNIQRAIKQ
ncbi:MAG: SPOR domain-containing protein [Gammaproteobacteria bacterium]|nr:SPOR domain-containing protein [Gammaproteobacteria bacterium]MDH5652921.1 SPOR domain-containing protein [Gammaproteobacteria bacterium]